MIRHCRFALLGLALVAVAPAAAQHAAHEHGKAELNVAVETEQELVVELLVPAESVYGFEHEPSTDAERRQRDEGLRRVEGGMEQALAFDSSRGCSFEVISSRDAASDHDDHDDDHGHDDHGADDDHGHHDDHDAEGEGHGHSDVHLQWSVSCKRSIAGTTATFDWAELLPGVEEVAVILLSTQRQDELRLEGGSGVLRF